MTPLPAKFWARVDKNGPEGVHSQTGESLGPCWVWTASCAARGYGIWQDGKGSSDGESQDEDGESEHRYCARIEHGNGGTAKQAKRLASDPAVVSDGSGYAARLRVLPTFGCALHEAKS